MFLIFLKKNLFQPWPNLSFIPPPPLLTMMRSFFIFSLFSTQAAHRLSPVMCLRYSSRTHKSYRVVPKTAIFHQGPFTHRSENYAVLQCFLIANVIYERILCFFEEEFFSCFERKWKFFFTLAAVKL